MFLIDPERLPVEAAARRRLTLRHGSDVEQELTVTDPDLGGMLEVDAVARVALLGSEQDAGDDDEPWVTHADVTDALTLLTTAQRMLALYELDLLVHARTQGRDWEELAELIGDCSAHEVADRYWQLRATFPDHPGPPTGPNARPGHVRTTAGLCMHVESQSAGGELIKRGFATWCDADC